MLVCGQRKDWSIVILSCPNLCCRRQLLETWLCSDTCSPRMSSWGLCGVCEWAEVSKHAELTNAAQGNKEVCFK